MAQVILTGLAVGAYYLDPSSAILSSLIGLWGPIQTISFGHQLYQSYNQLATLELVNGTLANDTKTNGTNGTNGTFANSTQEKPADSPVKKKPWW